MRTKCALNKEGAKYFMKYSSSNKPLVCMQTQSSCYKGTKKMTVKGILWHSTGANNPTLKRYVQPSDSKPASDTYSKSKWLTVLGKNSNGNDWNHTAIQAGVNAWIGKLADGTVACVQTMPWNYRPWGCGSGSKGTCNDGWIQFEICEDALTDKTYFDKVYQESCEITAYLCKKYDIDPNGTTTLNGVEVPTILCHADSYKLKLGSNHSDVNHWFNKYNKSMTTVRKDVAELLNDGNSTSTTTNTVKTYKVVTPVNKYSTAADAKAQKNAKSDKLAVGTYYIYTKYPDGVNGMYNVSSDKTGASAGSWINPKENVIKESSTNTTTSNADKLYRVRKSKDDAASQKGAYSSLDGAKKCCQSAGAGYHVFDWDGKIVYSYQAQEEITLSSIVVTKLPVKTEYLVGENFDGTGIVLTATYSDKSTKVVTDYSVLGFSSDKAGSFTITIKFEDKTTTFGISVSEKQTEEVKVVAVYDLDYPEKTKIIDKSIIRTNKDCVRAIKKILSNNSAFNVDIAKAFFTLAPKYCIDPMMAIAQSIIETGWFKYSGSAVTADQHNYCGLGVTSNGTKGAEFATIEYGVTAQLQHLYAYGCKTAVPIGEAILDPRFSLVTRGIATIWQQLAGRWACPGYDNKTYTTPQAAMEAGNTYGQKILAMCKTLEAVVISNDDVEKYFPSAVDEHVVDKLPDVEVPTEPDIIPEPEAEEPITDSVLDGNNPKDEDVETEDANITNSSTDDLATLIFNCIKKLIIMLIKLFNKGE